MSVQLLWNPFTNQPDYVGTSSGPIIIPVPVSQGGTGDTSFTPYALIAGGVNPSAALEQVESLGTLGQILISQGAGQLPIFGNLYPAWTDEISNFNAAAGGNYFCYSAITATLPTTGLYSGAQIRIYADTTGMVTIQAASGQYIQVGNDISESGGTAVSLATTPATSGSSLTLIYRVADTSWHAISSIGTWVIT